MITTTQIYWITMLDSIGATLFTLTVLLGVTMLGLLICGCQLRCDYSTTEHGYSTGVRLHVATLLAMDNYLKRRFVCL